MWVLRPHQLRTTVYMYVYTHNGLAYTCCLCSLVPLQAKVSVAEQTEKDIDATRLEYVPVAVRTQILFFCVSDLSNVDPMYQYSLEWFLNIFLAGIGNSERAGMSVGPQGGAQMSRHFRSPPLFPLSPCVSSRHGGAEDRKHQRVLHLQPVQQRVPQPV